MNKVKISPTQLFVLIVLFEMGSSIVVSLGAEAKQDAWIAILFGMAGGFGLYLVYHRLYMYYPDLTLTGYSKKIAGKLVGNIISFLYIIYFIYIAARVLRDFGELLVMTSYTFTPLLIINALMMLVIIYAVYKGIEVVARTGELLFLVVYIVAISGFILIIASGLIDLSNLKPFMETGFVAVIKVTLTQTLTFPFGEMVVFAMLLPTLNKPKYAKKVGLMAILLSGINIAITMAINVAVLGPDLYSRAPFPLLTTISKIEFAEFIERLDVFFLLYAVIGGFFKIGIFFYAAVIGTAEVFNFKETEKLCFPIGIIILFVSISIAASYPEHIIEGLDIVPIYLHWPMQIIIPILLLIGAYLRNRNKTSA
ncbi:GerAB/ArcD/ProY family transporter [Mesobacillus harenae]|uniref:GerAB/ArcD/ProY family transporter n=1 Tax=Mesobacillus harenae TaxID=2213203 RepID=UPI00157FD5D5